MKSSRLIKLSAADPEGPGSVKLSVENTGAADKPRGGESAPRGILVVDDSPAMLAVVCEHFPINAIIGTATDGLHALEQAEALRPQLILMDLRMPRMNGLEATSIIRKSFPAIRVIIMTLDDTPEIRAVCRAAGAHGFVSKLWLHRDLELEIGRVFSAGNPAPGLPLRICNYPDRLPSSVWTTLSPERAGIHESAAPKRNRNKA